MSFSHLGHDWDLNKVAVDVKHESDVCVIRHIKQGNALTDPQDLQLQQENIFLVLQGFVKLSCRFHMRRIPWALSCRQLQRRQPQTVKTTPLPAGDQQIRLNEACFQTLTCSRSSQSGLTVGSSSADVLGGPVWETNPWLSAKLQPGFTFFFFWRWQ